MKTFILLSLFLVSLLKCEEDHPLSCKDALISKLESESVRNPRAELWEYTIEGKKYYYTPPYCCDMFSDLYDSECNLICHPDGGITGDGDGACGELKTKLINGILVWTDGRK
ncbi:MAG: hypothetical protein OEU76_02885 [Cyclobacteriaceae bacterium]|nr:hypothetical protein [Cyclobacteriaceae bacterium]